MITKELPGHEESIKSTHCGISSWVAFYSELKLNGCKEIHHLPILFDFTIGCEDLFVIFKSNPK